MDEQALDDVYPFAFLDELVLKIREGHSLKYVRRREREHVARDLKPIYTAVDADAAHQALEVSVEKWGRRFAVITQAWAERLGVRHAVPRLAAEVRRVIDTTDEMSSMKGRALSRLGSGSAGGWVPVRGLRAGGGGWCCSHPSGRAWRTRVSCGAQGLNQGVGRPGLARP